MLDVEEAAGTAAVDDFVERVGLGGEWIGVEGDIFGGEAVVRAVAAGFFADCFVGGTSVFLGR